MQSVRLLGRWLRAATGLSAVALAVVTGCSDAPEPTSERRSSGDPRGPLSVYVANYPLQYFAQRIGGSQVQVGFPVPAGVDPAFWKPTPEDVAAYQSADIILLNGASYSHWVSYSSLPLFRTVDTSAPFVNKYIPFRDKGTHSHGPDGEHEHGKVAFTTWLDPTNAIAQAETIRDALIGRRPDEADTFNRGFESLATDLRGVDEGLAAAFANVRAQPLVFSHPVYQYLIRRYDINGESVHWEPDESPSPEQWQELDGLLAEHPARWMIWEAEPDRTLVEELQVRGLGSLTFHTGANVPPDGDYLDVVLENVRRLTEAFSP